MPVIERHGTQGIQVVQVKRRGWTEVWVSGRGGDAAMGALWATLGKRPPGPAYLHLRSFGVGLAPVSEGLRIDVDAFEDSARPPAVQGFGVWAESPTLLSVQEFDRARAIVVDAGTARLAYLSGFGESGRATSRTCAVTFEQGFSALSKLGFNASDLVRTWCFLDDVEAIYAAFNEARRVAFARVGIPPARLPASTGVGCRAVRRTPLSLDMLAVAGDAVHWQPVGSPRQCEPTQYGVLFSRAVRIEMTGGPTQWIVSGTASIGEDGQTQHARNMRAQFGETVAALEALLSSVGLQWGDVVHATAYIRPGTRDLFDEALMTSWPSVVPLTVVGAHICRKDLAFEMELMCFQSGSRAQCDTALDSNLA